MLNEGYGNVHVKSAGCLRRLAGLALLGTALTAASLSWSAVRAGERFVPKLAILPFEIDDTSGEVGQTGKHDAMLATLTRMVGEKIAADGIYDVVAEPRVVAAVEAARPGTYLRNCNGCERDIARSVGADRVMMAWIFKMSSLVLTLQVVIKDVATGKVVFARSFDFRGDNERAWRHAADAMVKGLAGAESKS